jgi:hypothetical protein
MSSITDWIVAIGTAVAAIGTAGTLIAGLIQIGNERSARRRDELTMQARERRAQAARVSAWPIAASSSERTSIALLNGSESPVYRAIASLVMIQGAGPREGRELQDYLRQYQTSLALIPPGKFFTSVAGGWAGMSRRPGIELAFTDAAGIHWLRSADGSLSELALAPADHYRITPPLSWETPTDTPPPPRSSEAGR